MKTKVRGKRKKITIVFLLMIIISGPEIMQAESTTDWVENFDDSSSLDNWNIPYGNFIINETAF